PGGLREVGRHSDNSGRPRFLELPDQSGQSGRVPRRDSEAIPATGEVTRDASTDAAGGSGDEGRSDHRTAPSALSPHSSKGSTASPAVSKPSPWVAPAR